MAEHARRAGSHRAATAPRRSTYRLAAGVAALAGAGLLAFGGQGTMAYWTDSATVSSSTFTAGKLDLTVDAQQGNPTTYTKANLTLTTMVPGESAASTIVLRNAGDADFTWVPTVTKTGPLAAPLVVELYAGGSESGDDTTYPRTETCNGGTLVASGASGGRINVGANQNLCVKVTLPASTGDGFQSATSSSVTIVLAATQVIA